MYSQSVRASARRGGGRQGSASSRTAGRERRRLLQLFVCLALFLTVFIGKGVFPQKVREAGGQLLALMERNTDFRGAFARLGESLAGEDSVLGELGEFCVEVFGQSAPQNEAVPVQAVVRLEEERQFLNSGPDQAALAAHYFGLNKLPEGWLPKESEEAPEPEPEAPAQAPAAVPAVGTVMLEADYDGPELPQGYTMDRLSLGELETVTPVMGTLWSEYGYRDHPIDGGVKFHNGVDLGADPGRDIVAFAAGTVEYIGQSDVYGNYLQIDHGQGVKSFYAHCSALCVQKGQQVAAGEKVAQVGSTGTATGPHLHFELKCAGMHIDPAYYIQYKTPLMRRGRVEITPGFLLLAAWLNLMDGQGVLPAALLSCALHELGHLLVLGMLNIPVKHIRITAVGAEIRVGRSMSYLGELLAALSGPAVNLALAAALCRVPGGSTAAGLNLALGLFNLLPVGRLDGGRALSCLLALLLGPEAGERWSGRLSGAAVALAALGGLWLARMGGNVTLAVVAAWLLAAMGRGKER